DLGGALHAAVRARLQHHDAPGVAGQIRIPQGSGMAIVGPQAGWSPVDAHQHFWEPRRVRYEWLDKVPELDRDHTPSDLEPLLRAAGVARTVLVQSADSVEDTRYMLALAEQHDFIAAVVGWAPLEQPELAGKILDEWQSHPKFRGVRHL